MFHQLDPWSRTPLARTYPLPARLPFYGRRTMIPAPLAKSLPLSWPFPPPVRRTSPKPGRPASLPSFCLKPGRDGGEPERRGIISPSSGIATVPGGCDRPKRRTPSGRDWLRSPPQAGASPGLPFAGGTTKRRTTLPLLPRGGPPILPDRGSWSRNFGLAITELVGPVPCLVHGALPNEARLAPRFSARICGSSSFPCPCLGGPERS